MLDSFIWPYYSIAFVLKFDFNKNKEMNVSH